MRPELHDLAGRVHDPGDGAAVRVLGVLLLLRAHAGRRALPRRRRARPRILGLHVEVSLILEGGLTRNLTKLIFVK